MATDLQPSKCKRPADGAYGGEGGADADGAPGAEGGARGAKRLRLKVAPRGARIAHKRSRGGGPSGCGGRDSILRLMQTADEGSQQM